MCDSARPFALAWLRRKPLEQTLPHARYVWKAQTLPHAWCRLCHTQGADLATCKQDTSLARSVRPRSVEGLCALVEIVKHRPIRAMLSHGTVTDADQQQVMSAQSRAGAQGEGQTGIDQHGLPNGIAQADAARARGHPSSQGVDGRPSALADPGQPSGLGTTRRRSSLVEPAHGWPRLQDMQPPTSWITASASCSESGARSTESSDSLPRDAVQAEVQRQLAGVMDQLQQERRRSEEALDQARRPRLELERAEATSLERPAGVSETVPQYPTMRPSSERLVARERERSGSLAQEQLWGRWIVTYQEIGRLSIQPIFEVIQGALGY